MTRINKADLRSIIVDEIKSEFKIKIPETKIKLENELEPFVDVLFNIDKKLESGVLSERNAIILFEDEIEKWGFNLLKEKEFVNLDIDRLKESIIHSLFPPDAGNDLEGGGSVDL